MNAVVELSAVNPDVIGDIAIPADVEKKAVELNHK